MAVARYRMICLVLLETIIMKLPFKNARDVKLLFRDDLEKGSEKNG